MSTFNNMVESLRSRANVHEIKNISHPKKAREFIIKYMLKHGKLLVNRRHCLSVPKNKDIQYLIKIKALYRTRTRGNYLVTRNNTFIHLNMKHPLVQKIKTRV